MGHYADWLRNGVGLIGFLVWAVQGVGAPVPLRAQLPAESSDSRYELKRLAEADLEELVVTITSAPGDPSRVFAATQPGRIWQLSGADRSQAKVFLDLRDRVAVGGERGLCSMVFHPGYATNGQFFVFFSHQPLRSTNVFSRVSRFRVDPTNPERGDPASEEPLISQLHRSEVHHGGDMHFGPDGYLYISVGDEGYGYQWDNAGRWDINFFSGILRIDPDMRPGSLLASAHPSVHPGAYGVPADNPFLNRTNYVLGSTDFKLSIAKEKIVGEFWAVGMRNPWRMSFDRVTGDLYANDVGVASREEINIVQRGAHHGWYYSEGTKRWPFPVPEDGIVDPIHEYEHTQGRMAITGSLFYRGTRYPELDSAYLFSDFGGPVYAMRRLPDGRHATPELIATTQASVTLGLDPLDGSILLGGIGVNRLVRTVAVAEPPPALLSQTGLFGSVGELRPAPGMFAYDVNQAFWSDDAIKTRWFGVSEPSGVIGFDPVQPWTAPAGTIWVKHFDFAMSDVDPRVRRRLETRVTVRTREGIYGLTYRWNEAQTDAELVEAGGREEDLVIATATGTRVQRWRYPSRTECLACHTAQGGYALSFNTAQLNRPGRDGTHQLSALQAAGYFVGNPVVRPNLLPAHPALEDEGASVESRVRSYLEVNCSQCHQPASMMRTTWDARAATPLAQAHIVGEPAVHQIENGGIKVVDAGKLETSILYRRVAEMGPLHMPPLGTFVVNTQAAGLLARWVTNDLPVRLSYERWAARAFLGLTEAEAARDVDVDRDGDSNFLEFLAETNPLDAADRLRLRVLPEAGGVVRLRYRRAANRVHRIEVAPTILGPWEPLDAAGNGPVQAAVSGEVGVVIPAPVEPRFYRLTVTEP